MHNVSQARGARDEATADLTRRLIGQITRIRPIQLLVSSLVAARARKTSDGKKEEKQATLLLSLSSLLLVASLVLVLVASSLSLFSVRRRLVRLASLRFAFALPSPSSAPSPPSAPTEWPSWCEGERSAQLSGGEEGTELLQPLQQRDALACSRSHPIPSYRTQATGDRANDTGQTDQPTHPGPRARRGGERRVAAAKARPTATATATPATLSHSASAGASFACVALAAPAAPAAVALPSEAAAAAASCPSPGVAGLVP